MLLLPGPASALPLGKGRVETDLGYQRIRRIREGTRGRNALDEDLDVRAYTTRLGLGLGPATDVFAETAWINRGGSARWRLDGDLLTPADSGQETFSDTAVGLKQVLWRGERSALAMAGQGILGTGRTGSLTSTGSDGWALSGLWTGVGDPWRGHAGASLAWQGRAKGLETQPSLERAWTAHLAAGRRLSARTEVLGQCVAHGSPYPRFGIAAMDRPSVTVLAGLRVDLPRMGTVEAGLAQGLGPASPGTGWFLSVARLW